MEDDFDTDLNSEPPEASPSKADVITADGEEGIITDDVIPSDSDVKPSDAVDVTPAESSNVTDAKIADSDDVAEETANEDKAADQDGDSEVKTADAKDAKSADSDDVIKTAEIEDAGQDNVENDISAKLGMYNFLSIVQYSVKIYSNKLFNCFNGEKPFHLYGFLNDLPTYQV